MHSSSALLPSLFRIGERTMICIFLFVLRFTCSGDVLAFSLDPVYRRHNSSSSSSSSSSLAYQKKVEDLEDINNNQDHGDEWFVEHKNFHYNHNHSYSYNYGSRENQNSTRNSNLRKQFKSDGILYKKSVLSPSEFQTIHNQLSKSNIQRRDVQNEKSNTVARNRVGMSLSSAGRRGRRGSEHEYSDIVGLLSDENGSLCSLVNDIAGPEPTEDEDNVGDGTARRMVLSEIVPVEVSIDWYPTCHLIDLLFVLQTRTCIDKGCS